MDSGRLGDEWPGMMYLFPAFVSGWWRVGGLAGWRAGQGVDRCVASGRVSGEWLVDAWLLHGLVGSELVGAS